MKTKKKNLPRRRPQVGPQSSDGSHLEERMLALINEACAAYSNPEQMTFKDWYAVEHRVEQKLQDEHTRIQR